ncbi:glycerophosphodiester phosphodiesterase family protein [Sedimentitalea sp. JM2-8]|uniref:Glycerophosphodiester phosphodiesterase family protein n=1 Tax=Sedimentitalea xiamensis TaxID=3050037 RepID=A0ABT7FBN2_9RHOB|nr:glycerophosphodiester phosphodiesterase family protein [Sedimentitalea xiamensis]MDK3072254.1 glycerophosphodiester phosphodiesterase family protein [Sedimentitalea xiamensis]
MNSLSTVLRAFGDAWSRRRMLVIVYLVLRITIYAVLAPVLGLLINLAVSMSDQAALTDQDIAGFLLTPGGFVAAVAVLSLLLVVEVLGFALMAAIWRAGGQDSFVTARTALFSIIKRMRHLILFAGLFLLRVLAMVLPFVLAGLFVAWWLMGEYDINYYLSNRPPEAIRAAVLIGLLLLALLLWLLARLTSWALALHLVVFEGTSPMAAFGKSAELMVGERGRLAWRIVIWFGIRFGLLALLGLVFGLVLNLIPLDLQSGLRTVLAVTLGMSALWALSSLVVSALALGALARIVDGFFDRGGQLAPVTERADAGLRRRLVIAGAVGLAVIGMGFWSGARLLDGISTRDDVTIIAHRGAAGSRPENTLASVQKALEDGADWVEIDVQETADGQIVVVHDSDFMKLSGVDLKIWDATMEDLAQIDIGGWFAPEYSDQRTPLLRDVLEMAKGRAGVVIELKFYGHDDQLEARVAEIVEDLGMADQIATMSLKYPMVQKMRDLRPDWRTGVLAATAVGDPAGLVGDFVAVSAGQAKPWLARSMQAAGKDLYVWTVNDPLDMSKMISMGADGLITDEPALARQVLEFRAGLSTPERLVLWLTEELGLSLNERGYRDDSP